jgi:hypothetical protein
MEETPREEEEDKASKEELEEEELGSEVGIVWWLWLWLEFTRRPNVCRWSKPQSKLPALTQNESSTPRQQQKHNPQ